ncbi:Serine/threonine protein kinase [Actinacidiphila alni]|uniref:Serine/threonine protein kinase n=1 Tax=Actinacidiphila alni TaxID=380248 RepID=A0A1I1YRP7_9ACTN|nr:serine/threonine-protein kinase [Actinacidiphila alni]SFE20843.1 Serine/threonine protein kinase [Actinacidiphila alni]
MTHERGSDDEADAPADRGEGHDDGHDEGRGEGHDDGSGDGTGGGRTRAAKAPLDVPTGYRVGDWTVTGLIGSGSWGSVYTAEGAPGTPRAGQRAALKFLGTAPLAPGQRAEVDELVGKEVRFSLAARHPHLIRTYEALPVSDPGSPALDGSVVLAMDRAERSVQDVLAAAEPGAPVPDAVRVLRGTASGLAHLHGEGWLHGDLKPANILLGPDGEARLADFGLTTELDGTHAYVPPMGTLDHLPPEWWSERTGSLGTAVRPTADVWAFGVVAHQVLSGGLHPFPGATARARALAAQAYARGRAPLRLDASLPEGWRRLITDCLAPDHAARAGLTAAKLAERVEECAAAGSDTPAKGRASRTPLLVTAVVVLLAAAGTATGLLLTGGSDGSVGSAKNPGAGGPSSAARTGVTASPVNDTLPAGSDVPQPLRPFIGAAARLCVQPEVTPALIAAMLKAESGFDAHARRPSTDEYGIAMWTPRVFKAWAVDGDHDGTKDYMSAPDAIATMGAYLCWVDEQLKQHGLHTDLPQLTAAAYRTSTRTIEEAGGVPARVRPYVDKVTRYLADYTPRR